MASLIVDRLRKKFMKSLIINAIGCCAILFPATQVQAAGAGSTFGGFTAKQKFSLKVVSIGSATQVGTTVTGGKTVPGSLPKFKVNQIVKFTIGRKGQLTGPGFSLPFDKAASTASQNNYNNFPIGEKKAARGAVIFKDTQGENNGNPTGGTLVFSKVTVNGPNVTTKSVTYSLYSAE